MRRSGLLALAVAAGALATVWQVLPAGAPPVYDTCLIGPYQLLGSNPPPTSASQTFPPTTSFPTSEVLTDENPAQAQILMTDGTFVSPTSAITVSITPIPPPARPPVGDSFDGNVYRIIAVATSGQQLNPQHSPTIVLRATSTTGPPRKIARLDGTTWTKLQTFISGCGDEYEAVSTRLGDFAILKTGGGAPSGGGGGGGGVPAPLVIAIIVVVLLATTFALARLNRGRGRLAS